MRALLFLLVLVFSTPSQAKPAVLSWACVERGEPYCYADAQGRPAGLVVRLIEEIGRDLGIRVQTELLPWARAQAMVREGRIDLLVTLPTEERFAYAYFGREALAVEPMRLFLRQGQPGLAAQLRGMKRLEDLRSIQLVTYLGDGYAAQYLNPGFKLQQMARPENIPLMLLNGRAQASLVNLTLFQRWILDQKLTPTDFEQIELDWPHTQLPRLFMLSRRSAWHEQGLLKAMDGQLRLMKRDGRWQGLVREAFAPYGLGHLAQHHGGLAEQEAAGYYKGYEAYPEWRGLPGLRP